MNKLRVLFVDDEVEILENFNDYFGDEDLEVHAATSGNDAFKKLFELGSADLLVTDMRMPNGDGIHLVNEIRTKKIPVRRLIVASGYTQFSESELADLGVDHFLSKPIDFGALNSLIDELRNST